MRYLICAALKFAHPEVEAVFREYARNISRDTPEFHENSLSMLHDLIVPPPPFLYKRISGDKVKKTADIKRVREERKFKNEIE